VVSGGGADIAASPSATSPSIAASAPPTSTADPAAGNQGRILTQTEAQNVARAIASGLSRYWHEKPNTPEGDDGTAIDPQACRALANASYLQALDADKLASARVSVANGGTLAVSFLSVTITSYAVPVPASVFAEAEAARAACPRFTATNSDGFQINFQVTTGSPPHLGEQAWRLNQSTSSKSLGRETTGTQVTVMVRIGHTLITASMSALNEPSDEALFLKALTRVVKAVP
jgi:hypothetical protein